jgi:hypothetical protein
VRCPYRTRPVRGVSARPGAEGGAWLGVRRNVMLEQKIQGMEENIESAATQISEVRRAHTRPAPRAKSMTLTAARCACACACVCVC